MLNLNSILLFSEEPEELAEFYQKVLEKEPEMVGGDFTGFMAGNCFLTIGPHSELTGKSKEPKRVMINFETDDVEGEFKRIKELGAEVIAEPYHPDEADKMWITTFEDPDGNYFQLMSPPEMPN